jgi:hypothetical protein
MCIVVYVYCAICIILTCDVYLSDLQLLEIWDFESGERWFCFVLYILYTNMIKGARKRSLTHGRDLPSRPRVLKNGFKVTWGGGPGPVIPQCHSPYTVLCRLTITPRHQWDKCHNFEGERTLYMSESKYHSNIGRKIHGTKCHSRKLTIITRGWNLSMRHFD